MREKSLTGVLSRTSTFNPSFNGDMAEQSRTHYGEGD
jgi:hypothetical protein